MGVGSSTIEDFLRCELCSGSEAEPFPVDEEIPCTPPPEDSVGRENDYRNQHHIVTGPSRRALQNAEKPPPGGDQLFSIKNAKEHERQSNKKEDSKGIVHDLNKTGSFSNDKFNANKSHTPTSPQVTPRKPMKRLYTPQSSLIGTTVPTKSWQEVEAEVSANPQGAYFIYSPASNGCWSAVWSKTVVPNAWAFSVPQDIASVPNHKFLGGKKDELAHGIHSSTAAYCQGILNFLKLVRRFRGSFILLEESCKQTTDNPDVFQELTIALHNATTQEVIELSSKTGGSIEDVSKYDAAVSVTGGRGPGAIREICRPAGTKVPVATFVGIGKSYGDGLSFLE